MKNYAKFTPKRIMEWRGNNRTAAERQLTMNFNTWFDRPNTDHQKLTLVIFRKAKTAWPWFRKPAAHLYDSDGLSSSAYYQKGVRPVKGVHSNDLVRKFSKKYAKRGERHGR